MVAMMVGSSHFYVKVSISFSATCKTREDAALSLCESIMAGTYMMAMMVGSSHFSVKVSISFSATCRVNEYAAPGLHDVCVLELGVQLHGLMCASVCLKAQTQVCM